MMAIWLGLTSVTAISVLEFGLYARIIMLLFFSGCYVAREVTLYFLWGKGCELYTQVGK